MAKEKDKTWQIAFGGRTHNPGKVEKEKVDDKIEEHLDNRTSRLVQSSKLAELEKVTERDLTDAARARQERILVAKGEINPVTEEGNMEDNQKKVEEAAAVAAEAASIGVAPEDAAGLGVGKSRLVVIKPETGEKPTGEEKGGGWSIYDGRPVRDTEGDYTFSQAMKILQHETPKASTNDNKKPLSLAAELAEAKQMLEALGIYVGPPVVASTPPAPRSLKQEVGEAMGLLQSLGIDVKTNEQAPLREQVAAAKGLLEDFGLTVGAAGVSPDERKEDHRHAEKMEELKTEKEYKEGLVGNIADLTESIGMGAGREMLKGGAVGYQGNPGAQGSPGALETFTCGKCGTKIHITPETKTRVQCPKCGEVYTREITPPPGETEPGSEPPEE